MARNNSINNIASPIPAWITPALSNNWIAYGSGYQPLVYRRWPDGLVEVAGAIKNSAAPTSGTLLFTLPANCRPLATRGYAQVASNTTGGTFAVGQLEINSLGQIRIYFTLSGLGFITTECIFFAGS